MRNKLAFVAASAAAFPLVMFAPGIAQATTTTLHVTTTADTNDGSCTATLCSFRDALSAAETGDTILLPAGHYKGAMLGGNGVWAPDGQFTIKGAGAGKTIIDGNHLSRTFAFYGQITVEDVTVTGGIAPGAGCSCGGGFEVRQGGFLTLDNSIVTGNSAPDADGGGIDVDDESQAVLNNDLISQNSSGASGGGIHVGPTSGDDGILTMTDVTLSGNTAAAGGAGLFDEGTVTASNVTFAGNAASASGGAVDVASGGHLALNEATIADNTAHTSTPGILNSGTATAVTLENTIVADSKTGDCSGTGSSPVTSYGHNLESGTSCGFTTTGDKQKTSPDLGGLAADGGNDLPVLALHTNSPAIDAGNSATCTSSDERGLKRPRGKSCDIGAYELQTAKAKLTLPSHTLRVTSSGQGRLPAKCGNIAMDSCKVTATLKASGKTVGTVTGSVKGGKVGKLRLKLNSAGRKLHKPLKVELSGTSANIVKSKVKIHATLTLKAG